eukprot:8479661-Prorocentrum_lima.AAC.1
MREISRSRNDDSDDDYEDDPPMRDTSPSCDDPQVPAPLRNNSCPRRSSDQDLYRADVRRN